MVMSTEKEKTGVFTQVQHDQNLISDDQRTRDINAKAVLKYRLVLAHILKYAVPDFKDDEVNDLAGRIAADSKDKACAQIIDIESDHSGLVSIEFDICTNVITKEGCSVILNVEPQNKYRPSIKAGKGTYSLAQRGMYYISRLITEQLGVGDLNYSKLKKCYSIWLIFDSSISQPQVLDYKMTEQSGQLTTVSRRLNKEIDLAELIFITIDRNKTSTQDIFRFLNALFVDKSLLSEFIPVNSETSEIHKEVGDMCNISQWYKDIGMEKGIEEGIEKGREKGREEGREEGKEKAIFTFLDNTITAKSTSTEIKKMLCKFFSLTEEEAQAYYNKYSARNP